MKQKKEQWVKNVEKEARKIMKLGSTIWQEQGWKSGSDVNMEVLQQKLKKKLGKKKLNPLITRILEDANYHSENEALERIKAFKGKGYYTKGLDIKFKKYSEEGGKTWDL